MSDLVVRRLLVDLKSPPARHWAGGDAFRTAFFNALSMSFPAGEQFFIDAMRRGAAALPEALRAESEAEVRAFIGQEATHRHVHAQFNAHLAAQGLVNRWQQRIERRSQAMAPVGARNWVGATAATEHFTAILAAELLSRPELLDGCEPRLATMWRWHASEEAEHRSSAFDLYRTLGGDEAWRRRLFRVVTWHFVTDLARQTLLNLQRDGTLWRRSTWRSAWRWLFGREGLVPRLHGPWKRYLRADFHPSQQAIDAAPAWLAAHGDVAVPLSASAPAGSADSGG
jgi:predicted metal-dependent hydrolase